MKLVINSNVYYNFPATCLLNSLKRNNFGRMNDIILVISESTDDVPVSKKIDMLNCSITIVKTKDNMFDWSGFNILHEYKEHPLIASDSYFYLLDSSTVGPNFQKRFEYYEKLLSNSRFIMAPQRPNSNICVFGKQIIDEYQNNFNGMKISKKDAIALELHNIFIKDRLVKNIFEYGKFYETKNREFMGYNDIYKTNVPRAVFYYPDFDVYKYIRWGGFGEIKMYRKPPIPSKGL